jgi:hypothetical protein
MNTNLFNFRDLALSAGIGTAIVLILFSLVDTAQAGALAKFLLLPGAGLAEMVGSGAHDLGGLLLYIAGNVIFYAALPMLVFVFLQPKGWRSPHRKG